MVNPDFDKTPDKYTEIRRDPHTEHTLACCFLQRLDLILANDLFKIDIGIRKRPFKTELEKKPDINQCLMEIIFISEIYTLK